MIGTLCVSCESDRTMGIFATAIIVAMQCNVGLKSRKDNCKLCENMLNNAMPMLGSTKAGRIIATSSTSSPFGGACHLCT